MKSTTKKSAKKQKEFIIKSSEFFWDEKSDKAAWKDLDKFFNSPKINKLKELICDLGRRCYSRHYNDGNGGNMSVRVGSNLVLCTPTMISKGSMKPEDLCLVDLDGNQLCGTRKRTSEILAHLAIMKTQPKAKACCHAHPPYATAFALAGRTPARFINPEAEIFVGQIGLAEYKTPGTKEVSQAIGAQSKEHDCIFMLNHGVITWAKDIEVAYWKMENIEALSQCAYLSMFIGKGPMHVNKVQRKDLDTIRTALGCPVPEVDLSHEYSFSWDDLIEKIADKVVKKLKK